MTAYLYQGNIYCTCCGAALRKFYLAKPDAASRSKARLVRGARIVMTDLAGARCASCKVFFN